MPVLMPMLSASLSPDATSAWESDVWTVLTVESEEASDPVVEQPVSWEPTPMQMAAANAARSEDEIIAKYD